MTQASAPQATATQGTGSGAVVVGTPAAAPTALAPTSAEIYQALRAQRRELDSQLERLVDTRDEIARELRDGVVGDVDQTGLQQRLAQVDQQIASVSIRLAEADAAVAQAAGVPGATIQPPEPDPWQHGPPEEIVMMGIFFSAVLLFPVMLAFARRIWRRSPVAAPIPAELTDRLGAMERAVDAVAVEVERIGEGQRFVTQLLAERASGAAAPRAVAAPARGHAEG